MQRQGQKGGRKGRKRTRERRNEGVFYREIRLQKEKNREERTPLLPHSVLLSLSLRLSLSLSFSLLSSSTLHVRSLQRHCRPCALSSAATRRPFSRARTSLDAPLPHAHNAANNTRLCRVCARAYHKDDRVGDPRADDFGHHLRRLSHKTQHSLTRAPRAVLLTPPFSKMGRDKQPHDGNAPLR